MLILDPSDLENVFQTYVFQEVIQETREQMEKEEVSDEKIWLYVDVRSAFI